MSNWERETIINFCDSDDICDVYTYNSRWIKRIESGLGIKPYAVNDDGGKSYKLPKKMIKLPSVRKRNTEMTDEQKIAASERMKKLHEARRISLLAKGKVGTI